jgi:hypothetical protein
MEFPKRISDWSGLTAAVEYFSAHSADAWLFRGVSDETHDLVPKIGRPGARATKRIKSKQIVLPYRCEDEVAVFAMFKQQARAHLPSPPATPLEWLAVAQHFGLPTRLLDWTDSLLAAAWFAVELAGAKRREVNSAIWVTRNMPSVDVDDDGDPLHITQPTVYRPPHIAPRIAAQGSVLMICPKPTECVELSDVHKITIDRSIEFTIKKRLNACGINKRLLYADLSGLADHLSWLHKHDYLAGYRPGKVKASPTPDTADLPEIFCSDCGGAIDEPPNTPVNKRKRCPSCGSVNRTIHATF